MKNNFRCKGVTIEEEDEFCETLKESLPNTELEIVGTKVRKVKK